MKRIVFAMPEEKKVLSQGVELWTESLGHYGDPAILFIAGAGAHAHFWSNCLCQLFVDNHFFLIRYDHRDVGLSDPTPADYDLDLLVQDLFVILDAYGIERTHLVGHSMGGYIAQLAAAFYPQRVLSLTLISCGPVGMTPDLQIPYTGVHRRLLQKSWDIMLKNRPTSHCEESLPGYMGVWNHLNGSYPLDEKKARQYTEEMYYRSRYHPGPHEKHVKAMQKMGEKLKERSGIFVKIKTPTLIIHGEQDPLVFPSHGGQALAHVLPHAHLDLVPKMGHMFFNDEIEHILANKILQFVTQN